MDGILEYLNSQDRNKLWREPSQSPDQIVRAALMWLIVGSTRAHTTIHIDPARVLATAWSRKRLAEARERLAAGEQAPAIEVVGYRLNPGVALYGVVDGMHRAIAYREAGLKIAANIDGHYQIEPSAFVLGTLGLETVLVQRSNGRMIYHPVEEELRRVLLALRVEDWSTPSPRARRLLKLVVRVYAACMKWGRRGRATTEQGHRLNAAGRYSQASHPEATAADARVGRFAYSADSGKNTCQKTHVMDNCGRAGSQPARSPDSKMGPDCQVRYSNRGTRRPLENMRSRIPDHGPTGRLALMRHPLLAIWFDRLLLAASQALPRNEEGNSVMKNPGTAGRLAYRTGE